MNKIDNAQTIAQAKNGQSLIDFLMALPATMEAQIFYALVLGCLVGMIGHYLRAYATGQITDCLGEYLFKTQARRTWLTLITVITWSAGEVSAGLFTTTDGTFVGWGLVILSGLKTGYAGDSLLNKGRAPSGAPITVIEPLPRTGAKP